MIQNLFSKNIQAGENPFVFQGEEGMLEGILTWPEKTKDYYIALLGHPHPLYGGTIENKVVTTMMRAFKELNIPSLRFNFRGVGLSKGSFDAGIGESKDMIKLMKLWKSENPNAKFILAGFSFGSYVTYRAAIESEAELLISIAPPVHHFNFSEGIPSTPWLIFQGEQDEVVDFALVSAFTHKFKPPLPLITFPDTSHFFHGKLVDLKNQLIAAIQPYLSKA